MKNHGAIEKALKDFPKQAVVNFIMYIRELEHDKKPDGTLQAWWITNHVSEAELVHMFKKVSQDGLYIDGKHITLSYRKKLIVTYDYQAYKNRVLMVYPESEIDLQLVHKGDKFQFKKNSGIVTYLHDITDPFNPNPEIVGAYCIIKNKRGEFLELLNKTDAMKMKATATTKKIWEQWENQMWLKSVIKRACKRHFEDIVTNIEQLDNENYDLTQLDQLETPDSVLEHIKTFKKESDLLDWAMSEENKIYHKCEKFREGVSVKKMELKQDEDPITEKQ